MSSEKSFSRDLALLRSNRDRALKGNEALECWLITKEHFLQAVSSEEEEIGKKCQEASMDG